MLFDETALRADHVTREEFAVVKTTVKNLEGWVKAIDLRFWGIIAAIAIDTLSHAWKR